MKKNILNRYREEVLTELKQDILPFWMNNVIDFNTGSFNGLVSAAGAVDPLADKSSIMATRMLWTFSRAHIMFKDEEYLKTAKLVYSYMQNHFMDKKNGGVYWLLDAKGAPIDSTKKLYSQAFAIYALSEYSAASSAPEPLKEAMDIFCLCERYGLDRVAGGYVDSLGNAWERTGDLNFLVFDRGLDAPKTMNTNLHMMEAYSNLALHSGDNRVKKALVTLIKNFLAHIIQPNSHLGLFFDMGWKNLSDAFSYGHDIEASWLLMEAAEAAGDSPLLQAVRAASTDIAAAVLKDGISREGGIYNEGSVSGPLDMPMEWWAGAEAMAGFLNAYEATHNEEFLESSLLAWEFIKKKFLRPGGEWYCNVSLSGKPDLSRELAGPWKCPYHNSRACMEVYERLGRLI